MVFVQGGRVGLGQRFWVDRVNNRMAVVLVQARPHQGRQVRRLQAGLNAFKSLAVALQTAHQHRLKLQAAFTEIVAQALTLLMTQRGKIVVIVGAKRGLAVAH